MIYSKYTKKMVAPPKPNASKKRGSTTLEPPATLSQLRPPMLRKQQNYTPSNTERDSKIREKLWWTQREKNNFLPGIWWKNPSLQQLFGLLQLQQQLGSLHPAPRRQPLARRLGRFALAAPAPHLAPVGVQQIHVVVRGNASGGGGSAFGTSKAVIFWDVIPWKFTSKFGWSGSSGRILGD